MSHLLNVFDYKDNFEANKMVLSEKIYSNCESDFLPKITVCVPVFRPDEILFSRTLESVKKQDCVMPYEILIVNNEWIDKDNDIVYKLILEANLKNVTYYANKDNIGMIGNWNRCVELSNSNLITFCHADDELKENCLSRLLKVHKKYPECMIASYWDTIDENDQIIDRHTYEKGTGIIFKPDAYKLSLFDLFYQGVGFGVGCLFEKDKMLQLGGFCPDYYPSADYGLFIKYCHEYGLIENEISTFNYRKAVNESFNQWQNFLVMDKYFRECMIEKIKLPKWFLRKYSKAIDRYKKPLYCERWSLDQNPNQYRCRTFTKVFVRVILKLNRIRKYRMRLGR